MSEPLVMNADQVKLYLGIVDTTYDTQIDTFLPPVSDSVIQYLFNEYLISAQGAATTGSDTITDINTNGLATGDIIKSSAFPSGTAIASVDTFGSTVTLEVTATATVTETMYFRALPIGAKPVVAQMVLYRINGGTISGAGSQRSGIKSKSIGPTSITYSDDSSSIGSSGFPKTLENQLYPYKTPRFN